MSPSQAAWSIDTPNHRVIDHAIVQVSRLVLNEHSGFDHRYSTLVLALEVAEIDPARALSELSSADAELVRQLALGCLLQFRHYLQEP